MGFLEESGINAGVTVPTPNDPDFHGVGWGVNTNAGTFANAHAAGASSPLAAAVANGSVSQATADARQLATISPNSIYVGPDGHIFRLNQTTGGWEDGGFDPASAAALFGIPPSALVPEYQQQMARNNAATRANGPAGQYTDVQYGGTDPTTGEDRYIVTNTAGVRSYQTQTQMLAQGGTTPDDLQRIKTDELYRQNREAQQSVASNIEYSGTDANGNDVYTVTQANGQRVTQNAAQLQQSGAASAQDLDRIKANQIYANNKIAAGGRLQNIRSMGNGMYSVTNPDGSRTTMNSAQVMATQSASADDLKLLDQQRTQSDLDFARTVGLSGKLSNISYNGGGQYSATDYFGNHESVGASKLLGGQQTPAAAPQGFAQSGATPAQPYGGYPGAQSGATVAPGAQSPAAVQPPVAAQPPAAQPMTGAPPPGGYQGGTPAYPPGVYNGGNPPIAPPLAPAPSPLPRPGAAVLPGSPAYTPPSRDTGTGFAGLAATQPSATPMQPRAATAAPPVATGAQPQAMAQQSVSGSAPQGFTQQSGAIRAPALSSTPGYAQSGAIRAPSTPSLTGPTPSAGVPTGGNSSATQGELDAAQRQWAGQMSQFDRQQKFSTSRVGVGMGFAGSQVGTKFAGQ